MKYRTVFLFGAPGAGKGTQGRILGKIPNFFYCSCGDVFRSLSLDSPIGREFIKYSSRGKLVPDAPTVELWRQFVDNSTRIGQFRPEHDTLVLDGIPRNVHQAKMLRGSLDVQAIFYLRCVHMDQMVERLQRRALRENRLDDANLRIIKSRLKTYESETEPVIRYYGPKIVHEVNSDQPPEKVCFDILGQVTRL
jgi:adenylate kinase